jgi:hypothetical protein
MLTIHQEETSSIPKGRDWFEECPDLDMLNRIVGESSPKRPHMISDGYRVWFSGYRWGGSFGGDKKIVGFALGRPSREEWEKGSPCVYASTTGESGIQLPHAAVPCLREGLLPEDLVFPFSKAWDLRDAAIMTVLDLIHPGGA